MCVCVCNKEKVRVLYKGLHEQRHTHRMVKELSSKVNLRKQFSWKFIDFVGGVVGFPKSQNMGLQGVLTSVT